MERHKHLFSITLFLGLTATLTLLFLARCTFKAPSQPVWDVQFLVPLANEHYTMTDLADDSDDLDIQGEDVVFTLDHAFDPLGIGDYLKVSGAESSVSVLIPVVPISHWSDTTEGNIVMSDSIVVDQARMKSGSMRIMVNNPTSYNVRAIIRIPSLSRVGVVFLDSLDIPTGSDNEAFFVLDGYDFMPGGSNVIPYTAVVKIIGGTENFGGNVDITVQISDIYFEDVTAKFNKINVEIEEEQMELSIPEELEGFRLASANLRLALHAGFRVPIFVHLFMEAIAPRLSGYRSALSFDDSVTTMDRLGVLADTLEYPDDEAVADFVNSQPEQIRITGSVKIGKGENSVTLADTNTLRGAALLRAPLTVTLPDHITETDPDTLEIEKDTRDIIRDNLKHATLEARVVNHLPFGVRVTMLFDTTMSDERLYDDRYTPDLTISLMLDPAPVQEEPGNPGVKVVERDTTSQVFVDLDESQLKLFQRSEVYQGTRIEILGTNQQMVRVRPSDYIDVQANLTALIRTDFTNDDDDEEGGES